MTGFDPIPAAGIRELLADEKAFVPARVLELIHQNKLFKLFIPKKYGGLQLGLAEALPLIEQCAAIDGTFGWLVQIGAGGGYFAGFLPVKTARALMTREDFVIAGSGFPGATAVREEGGFRISNGSWNWCSGSQYATLFTANCRIAHSGEIRAFAFMPGQVQIERTWDAFGLVATTSDTMHVSDAFVPDHMTFDLAQVQDDSGYSLFHYPFLSFAEAMLFATVAGNMRRFLDEIAALAEIRPGFLRAESAGAEAELSRIRDAFYSSVQKSEAKTASQDHDFAALSRFVQDSTATIFMSAARLFFRSGMVATQKKHPLNKAWRDLSTTVQHGLLKQNANADIF